MNDILTWLWVTGLSFLPISELRGGIPYAMIKGGFPWWLAFIYCVAINALVAPLLWLFLATFHKLFLKSEKYKKWFNKFVERARKKLHASLEKWGWLCVALFIGIPLPMTGVWTGTLGAWALGLDKKKTMLSVIIGVIISGAIVTAIMTLGLSGFDFLVSK
ncbi:small multi-drug export protein [Candidatus Saccharibacteria bacterium]|nr:small multi-drug export protein [Candidatus Saccharibacteria bacterium]MCL1962733.1 small multi-drug export protein [Candidatus Saccharibacteria bacterium]